MQKKTINVQCPWCKKPFPVQIIAKYTSAVAIPQGGNLDTDVGHNQVCPNSKCGHQLFIRYI